MAVQGPRLKTKKAKAKPARRPTPKVSPLAGMSVEAWAEKKLKPAQVKVVAALRRLVRKNAPAATEAIKWGQPVFERNGPMAYIRPAGQHVTFGFWRGGELADPKGLLEGAGSRMKHCKLSPDAPLDVAALGAMVRQAAELNQRLGSPARR